MKTTVVQITAGRGPAECCWVVAKVLKYFIKDAGAFHLQHEILHREKGHENGTVQSVSIRLSGKDLNKFLQPWLGTIQWIGTSTYRKHHKRKNWFIGCFEMSSTLTMQIDEKKIQFQAIRSSGPGGQHANKVSSAVRALHKPTGIQVVAMDSRSQHQNKKLATQRLQEKVDAHNKQQLQKGMEDLWRNHLELQRGNPVRVFKGSDFKIQKKKAVINIKDKS
ncbi:MAG: peptide chain release factor H [Bacteroidota bacterium]